MGPPLTWLANPFPPAGSVRGKTVSSWPVSGCPRCPGNEKQLALRAWLIVDLLSLLKDEEKVSDLSLHPPKLV